MKKTGIIFLTIFLLAVAGLVIFFLTFNVNRYKPAIIKAVSQAIGRPVEIDRLSLGLGKKISFKVEGIRCGPGIEIKSASVTLRLRPLLNKRIEISSIVIENPVLEITKRSDQKTYVGEIDVAKVSSKKSEPASESSTASQDVVLQIDSVEIRGGAIVYQDAASPNPIVIQSLNLKASLLPDILEIQKLSAMIFGGKVEAHATIKDYKTSPSTDLEVSITDMAIGQLTPNLAPGAPRLNGLLSVELDATGQGFDGPTLSRTLNGRAKLFLKEGVLLNYNIVREILQKISQIPGAESLVETRFPGVYGAAIADRSTILHPVSLETEIQNGNFIFKTFVLSTDLLLLSGSGRAGLDKSINAAASLRMVSGLSLAVCQAAPIAQALLNAGNEFEIPVRVEGQLPQVKVTPDMQYLTSKIINQKAQGLVTDLISDPVQGVKSIKGLLGKISGD